MVQLSRRSSGAAPQHMRMLLMPFRPMFAFHSVGLSPCRVIGLAVQDLPPPPTEEAWVPPEVEGETPAACRQTLVELFRVPLMTKVHSVFLWAFWTGLLGCGEGRGGGGW